MPNLHLRARPGVARVRGVHAVCPLFAGQDELALRTLGVPAVVRLAGEREAAVRHARVDNARLEDVGVCAGEDARHHRAGGGADGEDAVRINAPVGDGVPGRGGDTE